MIAGGLTGRSRSFCRLLQCGPGCIDAGRRRQRDACDGVRPIELGETAHQQLRGSRHTDIGAAGVDAHHVAAHIAPGDDERAGRTVDIPVPADRHMGAPGGARTLPFGVAGAHGIDGVGTQFLQQAFVEAGIDMDELQVIQRLFGKAHVAVTGWAGEQGISLSHGPDCSSPTRP